MKKFLCASILVLTLAVPAMAKVDLSELYDHTTKPTVETIKSAYNTLLLELTKLNLTSEQKQALETFEKSLNTDTRPATLKRQSSRGPSWKNLAIKYIDEKYDLWESASYADETGGLTEFCQYENDSDTETDDWYFQWDSVKPVRGSKKSVAYIVTVYLPVEGKLEKSGKKAKCDYPFMERAFDANLDSDGKPVELEF